MPGILEVSEVKKRQRRLRRMDILEEDREKRRKLREKLWRDAFPWRTCYTKIVHRCTNPKDKRYRSYGARGVTVKVSFEDIREIWFRDKAYLLEHPSIDRINSDGHYSIDNIRFIEKELNTRRGFPVKGVHVKTQEKVVYPSAQKAAESINPRFITATKNNIGSCALGKRPTAYGYVWRFIDGNTIGKANRG